MASREARSLRILSEYLEPQARFAHYNVTDTVVFFGSARALAPDQAEANLKQAKQKGEPAAIERAECACTLAGYYDDARTLARMLTEWSKGLALPDRRFIVCSGGGPGIMEAANRGASEAAGISIGLGISLPSEPSINEYITRELAFEFHYFFMRKFWFAYLAKAVVVMPGGFGTLDEAFEVMTLIQTEKLDRFPMVAMGGEFWKALGVFINDTLLAEGTISPSDIDLMHRADTPEDAIRLIREHART
jgi:hypothetical protein